MPAAGAVDLSLSSFGGQITDVPASDLPPGASPYNRECAAATGSVKTRPGLGNGVFAPLAGNPSVNYLKTFTDALDDERLLFLDALGNLYQEFPQGTVAPINGLGKSVTNSWGKSVTLFGREYIAFSDGKVGIDVPRQWDGANYLRVSQEGPGAAPNAQDFLPTPAAMNSPGMSATKTIAGAPAGTVTIDPGNVAYPFLVPVYDGDGNEVGETIQYEIVEIWQNVQVTTTTPHGLVPGQVVFISGSSDPFVNGQWTVAAVISPTVFTFASNRDTFATGGAGSVDTGEGGGATPTLTRLQNIVTAITTAAHGYLPGFQVNITSNQTILQVIATISRTNGLVTVTVANPHGIPVGATIAIAGVTDTSFEGQFVVETTPNPTSFTYTQTGLPDATDATGQVNDVWTGTFVILAVPTPLTFTYRQIGPDDQTNNVGTVTPIGNVEAGIHQLTVSFKTSTGYITRPAPPSTFTAGGGNMILLQDIATGPADVVSRIIQITPKIDPNTQGLLTGSFYYIPSHFEIFDNSTTSLLLDFTDTALQDGTLTDDWFNLVSLSECAGVTSYRERLVWWGELNKLQNLPNMSFDGGFNGNVPWGWNRTDPTAGGLQAGGSRASFAVFGDAYQILGDGVAAVRGLIQQNAAFDYLAVPIITINTAYSVRARIRTAGAPTQGEARIRLQSASQPGVALAGLVVNVAQLNSNFQSFSGQIIATQAALPSDLQLQIFMDGTPSAGSGAIIDEVEIYPTNQPYNTTQARLSFSDDPESYDAITGRIKVSPSDGQAIRGVFEIRRNLYLVKEKSWYASQDDGQNEPDQWDVDPVSLTIGVQSIQGIAVGDEWAVVIDRTGLYIFWGGQPIKISQEIQPDWDSVNWAAGHRSWVTIDLRQKRILCGLPIGQAATGVTMVYALDYRNQNTAEDIAAAAPIQVTDTGLRLVPNARKWFPWTMSIASCAAIERTDTGTAEIFMGNGAGDGNVYWLNESNRSDKGAGIPWDYKTYRAPSTLQELQMHWGAHRKKFYYMTGLLRGSGTAGWNAQPGENLTPVALPDVLMVDPTVTAAVTGLSRVNGLVTVTCAAGHGLTTGTDEIVNLSGIADASFNDTFPILQILNVTQFTIDMTGLPDSAPGAGGTAGRVQRDFESTFDVGSERTGFEIYNKGGVAGSWFQLEKLTWSLGDDPWAPVRGGIS